MAPLVTARKKVGRPLPFTTDSPAELFEAGGWTNTSVVYPGEPAANYGRLTQHPGARLDGHETNLRTHLVTATLF